LRFGDSGFMLDVQRRQDGSLRSETERIHISSMAWGTWTSSQIRAMSKAEVTKSGIKKISYEDRKTWLGSVVSRYFGPLGEKEQCATCLKRDGECAGHFGHIELPVPIFPKHFRTRALQLLRQICLASPECSGTIHERKKKCCACGTKQFRVRETDSRRVWVRPTKDDEGHVWSHGDVAAYFRLDTKRQALKKLGVDVEAADPSEWALTAIPVVPNTIRRFNARNGTWHANPLTQLYSRVVTQAKETTKQLKIFTKNPANETTFLKSVAAMVKCVDTLMFSPKGGLFGRLNGKPGRIRHNLMGGTVNGLGRGVAIPNGMGRIDEVEIPETMAKRMTVPELVTPGSVEYWQKRVVERFVVAISFSRGKYDVELRVIGGSIENLKNVARKLRPGDVVHRPLQNGDIVLANRQPSLHKFSVLAMRVVIVPNRVAIGLNLTTCKAFNLDYDGDEVNVHVPQTTEARAEAQELMNVTRNMLSPQFNAPLMGIIFDALLAASEFTRASTFLERAEIYQLLMWTSSLEIKRVDRVLGYYTTMTTPDDLGPPNIMMPGIGGRPGVELWTGRTVFGKSLFPRDFSYGLNSLGHCAEDFETVSEDKVCVLNGDLVTGRVSSTHLGAKPGSFIDVMCKMGSVESCSRLLSFVQPMMHTWLKTYGLTTGLVDVVSSMSREDVDAIQASLRVSNAEAVRESKRQKTESTRESMLHVLTEVNSKALGRHVTNEAMRITTEKRFSPAIGDFNYIGRSVEAGSKGSLTNFYAFVGSVGPQIINGRLSPMFEGRCSPYMSPHDSRTQLRGIVHSSYVQGLTPEEYFATSQAGRKGLMDTTQNTAQTGYRARSEMKTLQNVTCAMDGTLKMDRNINVALKYGEEGFATEYFSNVVLEPLPETTPKTLRDLAMIDDIKPTKRRLAVPVDAVLWSLMPTTKRRVSSPTSSALSTSSTSTTWSPSRLQETRRRLQSWLGKTPSSVRRAAVHVLLTADALWGDSGSDDDDDDDGWVVRFLERVEYLEEKAWMPGGEPAGVLTAHAIGEYGTQMTLKSFHTAGRLHAGMQGTARCAEVLKVSADSQPLIYAKVRDPTKTKSAADSLRRVSMSDITLSIGKYTCLEIDAPLANWERRCIVAFPHVFDGLVWETTTTTSSSPCITLAVSVKKLRRYHVRMMHAVRTLRSAGFCVTHTLETVDGKFVDEVAPMIRIRFFSKKRGEKDNEKEKDAVTLHKTLRRALGVTIMGIPEFTSDVFMDEKTGDVQFVVVCENTSSSSTTSSSSSSSQRNQNVRAVVDAFAKIMADDAFDHAYTSTSSISAAEKILGVDAARYVFERELQRVLESGGDSIAPEHIMLMGATMSVHGEFLGITYHGTSSRNKSPLGKMTFEHILKAMMTGAVAGTVDPLEDVSANVAVGAPPHLGTGIVHLKYDEAKDPERLFQKWRAENTKPVDIFDFFNPGARDVSTDDREPLPPSPEVAYPRVFAKDLEMEKMRRAHRPHPNRSTSTTTNPRPSHHPTTTSTVSTTPISASSGNKRAASSTTTTIEQPTFGATIAVDDARKRVRMGQGQGSATPSTSWMAAFAAR